MGQAVRILVLALAVFVGGGLGQDDDALAQSPDEFRAQLARLGLSQVGAARHMGYAGRTVRRWAAGDDEVPRIVQLYLALARPEDVRSER